MSDRDEDERPRRKRKKKPVAKGSSGMVIIIVVAGVILLAAIGVVLIVMRGGDGDKKDKGPATPMAKTPPIRPMTAEEAFPKVNQIGSAYFSYLSSSKKAPQSQADLAPMLSPELIKMIDEKEGWIEMCYGWRPPQLKDGIFDTLVAWEKKPAENTRIVMFGTFKAGRMTEAEFQKAPKAPRYWGK